MSDVIKVDIWSDIACPWCYIGKRKFELGTAAFDGEVEVEYHSFELAPDTPVDFAGSEIDFLVEHKGMSAAQVKPMLDRVAGIAAEVGLDYDFDALQHTKTVKAHQLLHYAKQHGKQVETKERLLRAYFVEGRHVGRDEDLADLAADVGLDRDDALRSLQSNEFLDAVRADQDQAIQYGIQGVPFFVVDGKYGVSGAQSPETFTGVLTKVAEERAAVT
jgi:predicted DsbA family dithiol-disulfide isomerase